MTPSADQPKYWAFISYSHADSKWGKWLHKQLETFPVPTTLVGKKTERGYDVPKRLMPIFRDREELPGSSTLKDNIQEALEQSRYLVVICSPRSAASMWVNEEVLTFKAMGRSDRVLCLIVDGEPNATDKPACGLLECFPPAVRHAVNPDRSLSQQREEPIAADARPGKDGKVDALLKLASGLLGVGFDELKQRDARRRRRQKVGYAMAGAAFVVLLAWGAWEFQAQRVRLQNAASSMADFRQAAATFDSGDSGLGMAYLARALKKDPGNKVAAQRLFYELTYKNWVQSATQVASGAGFVMGAQFSPDFTKLAVVQAGETSALHVVDTLSGQTLLEIKGTEEWHPCLVSFCGNGIIAVQAIVPANKGYPSAVSIIDVATGEKLKEFQVEGSTPNSVVSTEDGKQIFIGWAKTEPVSYWNPHLHNLYTQDTDKQTDSLEQSDLQSGAIQSWVINGGESLLKPTEWPVLSLRLDERSSTLYAGSIAREKGNKAGYLEILSATNLEAAEPPIKVDAWILDIDLSSAVDDQTVDGDIGIKVALSCSDKKTRIYGKDIFTGATVLRSTIASNDRQQTLFLGNMLGLASHSGHAQITGSDGQSLVPAWDHGAQFASLASNAPQNFALVSWAGVDQTRRGGKVFVKSLLNPFSRLYPAPLEPALWWPSQSIFLSALSERADKLFIVRNEPISGGFRWDLVSVPIANRAARAEKMSLGRVKHGSIVKSPSGRYFACLAVVNDSEAETEILLCDVETRTEKCRTTTPPDTAAVVFSADGKTISAIGKNAVTIFDMSLRRIGDVAINGIKEATNWVIPDVVEGDTAARTVGIIETLKDGSDYQLALIDTAKANRVSTTSLPGRPSHLALNRNCDAVVVSWNEGETEKCALVDIPSGAILREFGDRQTPAAFSFDGSRLLMKAFPNAILYNTSNWKIVGEFVGHKRMLSAYAFDPFNRFIATGALDGTVRLWSLEKGTQIGEEMPPLVEQKSNPRRVVNTMEMDQSGERLIVGFTELSEDGEPRGNVNSLSVWDTSEQLATIPEFFTPHLAEAWFTEDGRSVVMVTGDKGGRFVSFLDMDFPDMEMPPAIWHLAQEVSGYNIAKQVAKADALPNVTLAVSKILNSQKDQASESIKWLTWYLSDPKVRTISPYSKTLASEYRRALTEDMRLQRDLIEAFEMDPSDDLNLANLALLTENFTPSEGIWAHLLKGPDQDKDVLFRRAVRLFENIWWSAEASIALDAEKELVQLVRQKLEGDLSWSPHEQGIARNKIIKLNREGFLKLIAYAGRPEAAKQATKLMVENLGDMHCDANIITYINSQYTQFINNALEAGNGNSACALEMRQMFWLDSLGYALGREMLQSWLKIDPEVVVDTVASDVESCYKNYPDLALRFWRFVYSSFQVAPDAISSEQHDRLIAASATLAAILASELVELDIGVPEAEFYARESLSLRQQVGVTGWPLANSKSLVGAALLQQDKLDLAESFVSEGAKELLSFKETIPEGARPRLTEAVNRAALLYEKKGDQELTSYWRSESEKLSEDPRSASAE